MATKSNPSGDAQDDLRVAQMQTRDSLDALRTAALTVYEYLLFGHDAGDAEGYAAAMTAYARCHARLVQAGYEPATLFALCVERVIGHTRETALLRMEQSTALLAAVRIVPEQLFACEEVRP